ncbi:hypothetical protein [Sinimarinibacterium flocculans]|uniref:hypothetical protein n=1 Tax=Sinimarinibacterium flocculans TaxID=985250 RepID=UPI003516B0DF
MSIRQQAVFFADLGAVQPTPTKIMLILRRLVDEGLELIPSTFQEFTPPDPAPQQRLRLLSPSEDLDIAIGRGRLDIVRQYPVSEVAPDVLAFSRTVRTCMSAVLGGDPIRAARLAYVVQTLNIGLSNEALVSAHQKLFCPPPPFDGGNLKEWTMRTNLPQEVTLSGQTLSINTILKVERTQGKAKQGDGGWVNFDGIISEFDLNTTQERSDSRFSADDFEAYVDAMLQKGSELQSALSTHLGWTK